MAAPVFTARGDKVLDRLGNLWTIEQATQRLHLIADLLADPKENEIGVEIGEARLVSLAGAIRQARKNGAAA